MQPSPPSESAGPWTSLPRWQQWGLLVLISVLLDLLLKLAGFPAPFLIGAMIAAVLVGTNGASVRLPAPMLNGAQALVGCLIAASLSPDSLPAFLRDWPVLLGAVLATLAGSSLLGWLISRYQILPGTVGVWGSAPGAATAMVLMAGAFGADQRLVAFMQYLRVVLVTAVATLIAKLWVGGDAAAPKIEWFPAIEPLPFVATIAVGLAGAVLGRIIRLPNPFFVGPMLLGLCLQFAGIAQFQLPEWLLVLAYTAVGWTVGLRFTRQTLMQVRTALPHVAAGVIALILFCAFIGFMLAEFAGVDPLTAYLATSPGGMDAVAIIAAGSSNVDMSFIMALQMLRFVIVLITGPWLARTIAERVRHKD